MALPLAVSAGHGAQVGVLDRARQALRAAEARAGVTAIRGGRGAKGCAGSSRLKLRQAALSQLADAVAPRFVPGTVAQVTGSTAALWAVAGAVMGSEDWCAVAGLPGAGLLAAESAGLVLSRTVLVPQWGDRPPRVLAALVDAYGLVVAGGLKLTAGDMRRIEARLRFTQGRLVVAGRWTLAPVVVDVKQLITAALGENQRPVGEPLVDADLVLKGGFGNGID